MTDRPKSVTWQRDTTAATAARRRGRQERLATELRAAGWTAIPPEGDQHVSYPPDAETFAQDMLDHVPRDFLVAATIAMSDGGRPCFRGILQESLLRWANNDGLTAHRAEG
jgi:Tfp pilus assembly protein PilW